MKPRFMMEVFALVPFIDLTSSILFKITVSEDDWSDWWKWQYRLDWLLFLPKFAGYAWYMILKEASGDTFYQTSMYSLILEILSLGSIYYAKSLTTAEIPLMATIGIYLTWTSAIISAGAAYSRVQMLKSLYPESYAKKLIKGPFYDIPKNDIDEYLALFDEPYATGDEENICEKPTIV